MTVVLDATNQPTLNGDVVTLEQLQTEVRKFAAVNPKHRVVAIKTDPQTKYDAYFQLQNAIVAAYKPLKCPPRISEVTAHDAPPIPPSRPQRAGAEHGIAARPDIHRAFLLYDCYPHARRREEGGLSGACRYRGGEADAQVIGYTYLYR